MIKRLLHYMVDQLRFGVVVMIIFASILALISWLVTK